MAATINLLPQEMTVSKQATKLVSTLKVIDIVFCVIVLVLGIAGVGYGLYIKNQLAADIATRDDLKTKVLSLESSEQQLILLQDRLNKIADIQSKDKVGAFFEKQTKILSQAPEEITVGDSLADEGNSKLGLVAGTIEPFKTLLSGLASTGYDSPLTMSSFSYNPFTGYRLVLNVQ